MGKRVKVEIITLKPDDAIPAGYKEIHKRTGRHTAKFKYAIKVHKATGHNSAVNENASSKEHNSELDALADLFSKKVHTTESTTAHVHTGVSNPIMSKVIDEDDLDKLLAKMSGMSMRGGVRRRKSSRRKSSRRKSRSSTRRR